MIFYKGHKYYFDEDSLLIRDDGKIIHTNIRKLIRRLANES